jgi:hypothetical protein
LFPFSTASGQAKESAAPKSAFSTAAPKKPMALKSSETAGIRLKDIETVKDLVERVGANSLKKLIDVMAR